VAQQQASVRYRWLSSSGASAEAIVFGLLRDLDNPLATPPPTPPAITGRNGTYSSIDRRVGGVRLSGTVPSRLMGQDIRFSLGADLQGMRDHRTNLRSYAGAPVGFALVDQIETVTELGPYLQVHWEPTSRILILAAARYDHLRFRVNDRLKMGGIDRGGERTMSNASGSAGASYEASPALTVYANGSTSFETPTTTELVNTTGNLGFNTTLGPQRTTSGELGIRGLLRTGIDYSLSGFLSRIRDAIIQAREVDGRAFFENAGKVRARGIEAGIGLQPFHWVRLQAAYSYGNYTFAEYRIRNGATTDTLDGKRLPGVPRHFLRASLAFTPGPIRLEIEQTTAGSVYGDDKNTLLVEGWKAGVTSVRLSGNWRLEGSALRPFAAIQNLFDRKYVGSVNLNGAAGRILEPAPGRTAYLGLELDLQRSALPPSP
jgi:iron complex outermembrane receptor protein